MCRAVAAARRRGRRRSARSRACDELPVGGAQTFDYPEPEHDLRRSCASASDRFVAYGQKCTHLSCAVIPQLERELLPLPVPRRRASTWRPAGRSPGRRAGRCRGSQLEVRDGTSTPPASRSARHEPRSLRAQPEHDDRQRRSSCIVLMIVVLQLWLLTATMNAFLGGDDAVVGPAALREPAASAQPGLLRYSASARALTVTRRRRGSRPHRSATLLPGYFALVMATGIVSIAAHFCGCSRASPSALLWVNVVATSCSGSSPSARLAALSAPRRRRPGDHARASGFFTWWPGTCVLGQPVR